MMFNIDMDGVLADFDGAINKRYGYSMADMSQKEKNSFWNRECVKYSFFSNLNLFEKGWAFIYY